MGHQDIIELLVNRKSTISECKDQQKNTYSLFSKYGKNLPLGVNGGVKIGKCEKIKPSNDAYSEYTAGTTIFRLKFEQQHSLKE